MSCHPAKLYALLANNAYFTNGGTPPEPWVVLPVDGGADPVSGFQASAYFNPQTGQLVVAYAGTDPGQSGDIKNDLQIGLGQIPGQVPQAQQFYNAAVTAANSQAVPGQSVSSSITGHSLGGGLAQIIGAQQGVPTVTFNAPGMDGVVASNPSLGLSQGNSFPNITNYNNGGDPVSKWSNQLGKTETIPGTELGSLLAGAAGALASSVMPGINGTPLLGLAALTPYLMSQHLMGSVLTNLCNPWAGAGSVGYRSINPYPMSPSKNFTYPRDPLAFDLDGDGMETTALVAGLHFDHDADGIATGTGWLKGDDAFLVRDLNGNGFIDTGRELFGDNTLLPGGGTAANGFAALVALDSNADGVIDASDSAFAELKLWQDLNQDGISQTNELKTLSEAGIASLDVANVLKNQSLGNGNTLAREGSFTRTDGSTGKTGDLNLAIDTFDTRFTVPIPVTETVKPLPNMVGSGKVRELWQAASQSASLQGLLAQFAAAPTREAQLALLDPLLVAWADTSGMSATLDERDPARFRIEYLSFGNLRRTDHIRKMDSSTGSGGGTEVASAGLRNFDDPLIDATYKAAIQSWNQKLHVLEAFNGQYFFNFPGERNETPGANVGMRKLDASQANYYQFSAEALGSVRQTLVIEFAQQQLDLLDQAMTALRDSVYGALVMQTRLKPLLDLVELRIDETGIRLDAAALNAEIARRIAADPIRGLSDLLDLDRYGANLLVGSDWSGMAGFDGVIDGLPQTPALVTLLNEFKVRKLTAGDDSLSLSNSADIVLAGDGNDALYGNGGNDRLFGQGGDDRLYGGNGDDLLSGGAGNDTLYGEAGADTYVFGRGFGHDTIVDAAENGVQRDTVRLLGLTPADIQVTADHADNLTFTIRDTGETLKVPANGWWWGKNGVGQYAFEDGSVWTHDDALRATVASATEGDDLIQGSSAGETILGQAGNDTLVGNAGNDVVDGGAGNDLLIGSTGWNWVWENGQSRAERHANPTISANGNDIYLFGRGDGQDAVIDGDYTAGNTDTLRFKEGVAPEDVRLIRDGNDLVLAIRGSSDRVTLKQYFDETSLGANGPYLIERIAFADGTELSFADVQAILFAGSEEAETIVGSQRADILTGQAGNDMLIGNGGDDLLEGGDGDDVLLGGAGRDILDGGAGNDVLRGGGARSNNQVYDWNGEGDTYRFGRGDGHDTIIDDSWLPGATDRIELKAGIAPDDVRLECVRIVSGGQVNDDLRITIRDTGETLTVKRHFEAGDHSAVEEVVFADGTVWGLDTIRSKVLLGEAGSDELRGFNDRGDLIVGGDGNDRLQGLAGNDILDGGAGDDTLEGGEGSDTYRFGLGQGNDLLIESEISGLDVVELAPGIATADVTVRWTPLGGMAVLLPDGSRLTVRGQASPWSQQSGIEQLRFADGTAWGRTELTARALAATSGDDVIVGGYEDDTLNGGLGNDRFLNLGGYDTYLFGLGDGQDVLEGYSGRIRFKPGVGQNDVAFTLDGKDLIVTISASGDSVRMKNWLGPQGINRFEFGNGALLSVSDVFAKLNVSTESEILYGSPGDDALVGSAKDSVLYGREGNDTLTGGAGNDQIHGEGGNDTLDGGADRDWLLGGEGQNAYVVASGMGLDTVLSASAAVADDTVVFAPGIRPEDVSVQLGYTSAWWDRQPGDVGYIDMVVGVGGNDALVLRNYDGGDLGRGAVKRFRFDDGTELLLTDLIARADEGVIGGQYRYRDEPINLLGSQADDNIRDGTSQSVIVRARGNDDRVDLEAGNDIVSAGSGNDNVYSGAGDDLIAGEAGDDRIDVSDGDDVVVFNYGDGNDELTFGEGRDTLSFGASVTPAMLSAAIDYDRRVVLLVDGGAGGSLVLAETFVNNLPGDLEHIQFVDAEGKTRAFDLAGWLRANGVALRNATPDAPLAFDGAGFEVTGSVAPAGGLEALAYAQAGDLFATANLADNTPTDGDDVLYGTPAGDFLDAGAGNDTALGLAGDDTIYGGEGGDLILGGEGDDVLDGGIGNDVVYGGWGNDQLTGGTGRDELYGEWGGDSYLYRSGDGEVIIDDEHRVLKWREEERARSTMSKGYGYGDGDEWGDYIVDDEPNVLSFGEGIRPEDLRYSELNGDLVIEFAERPGDRVILRGFVPNRATQTRSVDVIRFADGSEVVAAFIELTGKTITANGEGDWLIGTPFADTLIGSEGSDVLESDGGADRLVGDVGSDTYYIHTERDGRPTETIIVETWREQDANRLELTGDVSADALRLEFDGRDLLLRLTEEGDTIRFAGFDPRAPGMQTPVSDISLPWAGIHLFFDDLLARGVRIIGTPGNDVLIGTALADWIEGREADDTMSGGGGGDTYVIAGDGGADSIVDSEDGGEPNVLVLPEGTGIDDVRLSFDREGFLILDLVNTGNRVRLSGFDPMNPLGPRAVERFRFGSYGDEIGYEELLERGFDIVGTEENDALRGTTLADRIWGGDGNDLIEANPGGDWLAGESGNDVYVIKLGDGEVTIDDVAEEDAGNVLRFGAGIEPNSLRNALRFAEDGNGGHVLLIPYGDEGDVVRLTGFNPGDVLGTHAVERFEFDDGTVVDYATLVSWTFVVEGDNGGNALTGTNVGDRLYGYDGDDVLDAGGGEDVLTGGSGNDVLRGGAGRDAYVVNLGDGEDIVDDNVDGGVGNVLTFGEGIARTDVRVEVAGNDLLIRYGAGGDVVRVSNYAPMGADGGTVVDTFEFADGTAVTLREFMNHAPIVANPIEGQLVLEDGAFSLVLPDDLFVDVDGDAVLTRIAVSGYETLPAWLQYDAKTRTLYGTPANDGVGEFDVIVQGMDALGASGLHSFHVTVQNTNDAPGIGTPLANQRALEDATFVYALPAGSFRDIDAGDELSFSASLEDGASLPDWLIFDAQTQTFTGTPANANVGSLQVRVTATDRAGASVDQVFSLAICNTNDAPTVGMALVAQQVAEDEPFTYTLPQSAFFDADVGDRLTYSATLANGEALPGWLRLDERTGVFSGTPGNHDVGALQIRVTATDLVGASAIQIFDLAVTNTNDAPEVAIVLADQQAAEDSIFSFTVPEGTFNDADAGDVVTLSATLADGSALPAWLSFDAATRTFSGLPVNGDVGNVSLRVTATDLAGAQASQTFSIGVTNVNDAPEVGMVLTNQSARAGTPFTWQLPQGAFVDIDAGDTLTYAARLVDGGALPTWLTFDPASGSFNGTPVAAGRYAVQVTATDRSGAQASQTFAFDVVSGGGNLAPVTAPDAAMVIEDGKFLAWGNVLANDRDPEGKALAVANPGIRRGEYGVLTLLPNGSYAYVLDDCSSKVQALGAGESVVDRFSYIASDGSERSSGELAVTVQGSNDTPELARCLQDVQLAKGKAFSWQMPSGSFSDRDRNDVLNYKATLSNGKPLPAWLKFDAATQTFSGTAPANLKDSVSIQIVASDGHGECSTASDVFKISFGNKTVIPKGNEGVGNGSDAPPPGHDVNHNDGPGSSPGQPGRRPSSARDDGPLERFLDGFKNDAKPGHSAFPALDRNWFSQRDEDREQLGQVRENNDFERHWSELAHALNRLDAERQGAPAWSRPSNGADIAGLAGLMQGGGSARGGVDAISLACSSGTQLKEFSGLREGFGKLSC